MDLKLLEIILLVALIAAALVCAYVDNVTMVVFIYSSFSLVASILWALLQAPDLAITEAAVGAGVSTLLFLILLRNVGKLGGSFNDDESEK